MDKTDHKVLAPTPPPSKYKTIGHGIEHRRGIPIYARSHFRGDNMMDKNSPPYKNTRKLQKLECVYLVKNWLIWKNIMLKIITCIVNKRKIHCAQKYLNINCGSKWQYFLLTNYFMWYKWSFLREYYINHSYFAKQTKSVMLFFNFSFVPCTIYRDTISPQLNSYNNVRKKFILNET